MSDMKIPAALYQGLAAVGIEGFNVKMREKNECEISFRYNGKDYTVITTLVKEYHKKNLEKMSAQFVITAMKVVLAAENITNSDKNFSPDVKDINHQHNLGVTQFIVKKSMTRKIRNKHEVICVHF